MSLFSCSFRLRAEVITLKISLLRRCYSLAFNLFLLPTAERCFFFERACAYPTPAQGWPAYHGDGASAALGAYSVGLGFVRWILLDSVLAANKRWVPVRLCYVGVLSSHLWGAPNKKTEPTPTPTTTNPTINPQKPKPAEPIMCGGGAGV